MQRTNQSAQRNSRELFSNLITTIATIALIAVTAIQVPDVLIWLAK
jgi:hypothetical protein